MLGGQLGGLINARLELCAESAPAGHVIAQHQQQPEVQGWAHPAITAMIASKTMRDSLRITAARSKSLPMHRGQSNDFDISAPTGI